MNIRDLQPGSYTVVKQGTGAPIKLNIRDLPKGSYTVVPPKQEGFFATAPTGQSPYQTGHILTSPITSYTPAPEKAGVGGNILQGLKVVGKAALNLPTSGIRFLTSALNPKTYTKLSQAVAGGIQSAPVVRNIFDKLTADAGKELLQSNREAFQNLVEGLKAQYGSAENIQRSFTEDPVGTLLLGKALIDGGTSFVNKLKGVEEVAKTPSQIKIAPFEKEYQPKVAEEFAKQGITEPPISAVTKSKFLQLGEAVTAKSPFGSRVVEQVRNAFEILQTKTDEIINRIKPVKSISEENLGKTIQEGLQEYETNFRKTQSGIYDEFNKKYSGNRVTADNTIETTKDIVRQQGRDLFSGPDKKITDFQENLFNKDGTPKKLTFNQLKSTRTSIGEALAKDPTNSALRRLYGSLSDDMNANIEKIDPNAGAELKKISEGYKTGKQKIESKIAQSIEKSNPERIAQNLIKRNSADTLKLVKEMVGTERFGEISKSFLRQMFEDSETRGKFDIEKLKKNLANYDDATLNEILNKEQRQLLQESITELEKIKKLQDALKPGQKITEGSQTAFLQQMFIIPAKVSTFIGALFSGHFAIAASVLLETFSEAGGAKLFTTGVGRKLLTEGLAFTPPDIPKGASRPFIPGGVIRPQKSNE